MKSTNKFILVLVVVLIPITALMLLVTNSCSSSRNLTTTKVDTLYTCQNESGASVSLIFKKGPKHNHPLMAVWTEDLEGNYIQTLYVAKSIAKGVFEHGDESTGKWLPGAIRRPAALPVWSHKRGVKEIDGLYIPMQNTPMTDAVTGATPPSDFILNSRLAQDTPSSFNLFFEINQPWDWNKYWTNNKYPNNEDYKTSCQPSLIYKVRIDKQNDEDFSKLEVIGHGHHSGKDGTINENLSTISTALQISNDINLKINRSNGK